MVRIDVRLIRMAGVYVFMTLEATCDNDHFTTFLRAIMLLWNCILNRFQLHDLSIHYKVGRGFW